MKKGSTPFGLKKSYRLGMEVRVNRMEEGNCNRIVRVVAVGNGTQDPSHWQQLVKKRNVRRDRVA